MLVTTGKQRKTLIQCEINLLLTYSMVQSPSWEANWFAARQKIPRILWNPKVHYRTHKRPPPISILGQPNPVHISTSHLLEIHPNITHPSTPRSPQWSPSFRFPLHGASFLNRARNSRSTVITDLDTSKRSTQKAFSCCYAILETGPTAPQ